jgi:hypothetical protein
MQDPANDQWLVDLAFKVIAICCCASLGILFFAALTGGF